MPSAWVTLATNDGYALGALVLAHSLRRAKSKHHSHILYTDGVSSQMRSRLLAVFHDSTRVDVLDSNDTENLALIGRPDLGVTFTKLHCWRLTQYEKCVFLDADTLIIQNCDELFERQVEFAAAPDIGWPDLFNSGVFVFVPSNETYQKLVEFGTQHGTFDGGDQGLLNQYFSNWREMDASHRLPFIYNVTSGSIYSYKAAYKLFGGKVKIVHFLGTVKPWHRGGEKHGHQNDHWGYWQQIFNEDVVTNLPKGLNPTYIGPLEEVKVLDPRRQSSEVRYSPPKTPAYVEIKSVPSNPISNMFYGGDGSSSGNENASSEISWHFQQTSSYQTSSHQQSEAATADIQNPLEGQQSQHSESTYKEGVPGKSDEERYTAWDQGAPDYQGRDAFSFIKKQIESVLHEALPQAAADPLRPESPLPSPDPEIKNVITENVVPDAPAHEESHQQQQQESSSESSEQHQQHSEEQQHQAQE